MVVIPSFNFGRDPLEGIVEEIEKAGMPAAGFALFVFESSVWADDYSPWLMDTGERVFGGRGEETLSWIENYAVPYIRKTFGNVPLSISGYSLAGLFSLWAFYKGRTFSGVGCCSGSLWFDGWSEYSKNARAPSDSIVYLSLGGKEPGSGDRYTSTIGDCYAMQREIIHSDPGVRVTKFESNPGGHFSNPDKRVAKSIIWLISNMF